MIKKTFNSPKFISCCDDDEVFTEEFVDGNINTWSTYPTNDSIPWDRWVIDYESEGICEGYDLYYIEKEQVSYDKGLTWEDTSNVRKSSKIKQVCGCKIKEIEEEIANKQDILISGVNIKTINHISLIGEGNIDIQGGEGGDSYTKEEIDEKINELNTNIDINAQSIIRNADNIVDLQSNKVDKEIYNTYTAETDTKIQNLETNKAENSDLEALRDGVNTMGDKVSTLEEKVAEIEQNDYLTKDEGDTYYQPIGDYATKDEIPTVPTKVSAFENDKGYLTEHQSLDDYALKSEIPTDYVNNDTFITYTAATDAKIAEIEAKGYDDSEVRSLIQGNTDSINSLEGSLTDVIDTVEELSSKVDESVSQSDFDTYTANTEAVLSDKADKSEIPSLDGYATEQWVNDQGYLTEHQSLDDYYTKSEVDEKILNPNDYYKKVETSDGYIAIYNYEKDDRVIPEIDVKENDEFNYVKIDGRGTVWIASDGTTEQPITADKIIKWDNTSNQKFKTINNESILGEGNIVIQGGSGGAYLPLSGGTLTGHLVLGTTAETAFKKVETIRNTNGQANSASFYTNSDGSCGFFHKAYNGASAVNDAVLKFDSTGIQFAKGGSRGVTANQYYDIMTSENTYNKTYIDDTIGQIDTILNSI